MDNRLTKKRLSDLLSYEWIFIIIVCVASIILWQLVYTIGSVKLTAGQSFTYYYDYTIYPSDNVGFRRQLESQEVFSYDVLKLSNESINKENNVLSNRLSIQEGDVIFTDVVGLEKYMASIDKEETPTTKVRALAMIDNTDYRIGSIDVLIDSAKEYLKNKAFIDGIDEQTAFNSYNRANIDDAKVRTLFLNRNGKDNRFRSQANKNEGVLLEIERIEKLYQNVVFILKFIADPNNSDALIRYTKFSQSYGLSGRKSEHYEKLIEKEKELNRENDIYGINLGKLTGGKNITSFMQYKEDGSMTDIALLYFNFSSYQPHLQYESLSFICSTMKICMGIQE